MSFSSEVIILLGPPGAGKGTHALPLSQNLKLPHISTGDLFRYHLKNQTKLGQKAKLFIEKGDLVPDNLVLNILQDRIIQVDCENGYILDGFPRTSLQAVALEKILNKNTFVKVIYLNAKDDVLIERISGRLSCSSCGLVYHRNFSPPKKLFECDECREPLKQRKDDSEDVVQKRLAVYHEQTKPLIDYYKEQKKLIEIDVNEKSKVEIFNEISSLFQKPVYSN